MSIKPRQRSNRAGPSTTLTKDNGNVTFHLGLLLTCRNKDQIHHPERSRGVSRRCHHTPLAATTPFRVPRNAVPPASDSDEKCGSPSLISSRLLTEPSAGSSWYN